MDCLAAMREMPDKCFTLAVCDPPYGINVAQFNMGAGKGKRCSKLENRQWNPKDWDSSPPTDEWFSELFRVSENQIIFGGNYFNLPPCKCFLIWDKGEGMYGRSFSECEFAWTSLSDTARIFKYSPVDKNRFHPTQKPTSLYRWIFQRYAKPGDKILDTHLGSGSSRIAAYDAGLDFVGYEIDKEYFNKQEERFAAHTAQMNLFIDWR
jgi:site-specific DNA-methyltransferase (adenine-specific)